MAEVEAKGEAKGFVSAVLTKADGTVVELGVIASTEEGTMAIATDPVTGIKSRVIGALRAVKKRKE